jgi:ribosomal protein L29
MEVRAMAERDLQKDLEAVKEDMAQLRADLAELT